MRHVNLFEKNGGVLQEYVENLKCIPGRQLWGIWSSFVKIEDGDNSSKDSIFIHCPFLPFIVPYQQVRAQSYGVYNQICIFAQQVNSTW